MLLLPLAIVSIDALSVSYPPSARAFSNEAVDSMHNIVQYFAYASSENANSLLGERSILTFASDLDHVSFDYDMFKATDQWSMES